MAKLLVKNSEISILNIKESDYISLTDIAKQKNLNNADDVIKNWLRNRNTIELIGLWETIYNSNFKPVEFDGFRKEAGLNSFVLTPKKLDRSYIGNWYHFKIRPLGWHLCT